VPKGSLLILDASVVVKWFVREPDSAKSDAFLNAISRGEYHVAVPSLLRAELTHVLWKKRLAGYSRDVVSAVLRELDKLAFEEVPMEQLFPPAFDAAFNYGITLYDAFYVALAELTQGTLVTFDHDLLRKTKNRTSAKIVIP
jgi:predicted nucleic acid-binding protein